MLSNKVIALIWLMGQVQATWLNWTGSQFESSRTEKQNKEIRNLHHCKGQILQNDGSPEFEALSVSCCLFPTNWWKTDEKGLVVHPWGPCQKSESLMGPLSVTLSANQTRAWLRWLCILIHYNVGQCQHQDHHPVEVWAAQIQTHPPFSSWTWSGRRFWGWWNKQIKLFTVSQNTVTKHTLEVLSGFQFSILLYEYNVLSLTSLTRCWGHILCWKWYRTWYKGLGGLNKDTVNNITKVGAC